MTPLDDEAAVQAPPETVPESVTVRSGPHVGAALRMAREERGLSIEDVAAVTFIGRGYLRAVEDLDIDRLPSRPFTNGYVRAYARAVGLDPEAAVARFRDDSPEHDEPLQAPMGVRAAADPRLAAVIAGGAVILASIVLWNVARHAMIEPSAPAPPDAEIIAAARRAPGPMELGAPLPPPAESTTPDDYQTPGLADATAAGGSLDGVVRVVDANPPAPEPARPPGAPFLRGGEIYGAATGSAGPITLQAARPGSLVVRGPDGAVVFARFLEAGEAYRAPLAEGLVADTPEPNAFEVYVSGRLKGPLPNPQVALAKLADVES